MSRITRRQFLSDSFFAAALASTAMVQPRALRAQDAKKAGPNDILNVMVVGCGGRGSSSHIPMFSSLPQTRVAWLCDADKDILQRAADKLQETQGERPKTTVDMREALSDPDLDIVSCATTNHWHALCGVWAMQAGKHAYIEKPICHNIHEGRALVAAAKKYGVCCQVGSQCRSNPAIVEATRYVRDGKIGEVKLARGLCYNRRKAIGPLGQYEVPESVDYNIWSGPAQILPLTRPNFHYDWHWQRVYGNGDCGNQGPHQFDIARVFLGTDVLPNSVITYGGRLGYDVEKNDPNYVDAGDTANTEVSIYNYDGGKTLVFETRGLETDSYFTAKVGAIAYGTEGYVVQQAYGRCVAFDLDGKEVERFEGGGDEYHFSNFIQCILDGTPEKLNADARCGHLAAGLAHMGNISYYLGEQNRVTVRELKEYFERYVSGDDNLDTVERTVEHLKANKVDPDRAKLSLGPELKFDPVAEHFIDNDDARAMESRDYRDEFTVPDASEV
ncbi:MAG: Gfo/Idh/MocA family oxidoreductase [Thermoguttaceae bacterium]|nr:Gfo/Idh/MocA family oxidoreductase [Thermoguttaceae bacterium]